MPEDSTIRCYDRHAAAYDLYQSTVVPEYETAIEMTAMTLEHLLGKSPKVLDLGCGTGNASAAILKRSLGAKIFLLDGSASMVEVAEKKIEAISPGSVIGSKACDLAAKCWDLDLGPSGYDAVVSTLVLEHLDFDSYKTAIEKCFNILSPGGWLIAVEGYTEEESDMIGWFEDIMSAKKALIEDPDLCDFVSSLRSKEEVHYYTSKSQKAVWWRDAGFNRVHVVWQYLCIALMAGQRPF
ncbi:MAG TPA: methyltransferase domain-containing protein [Methanotrichaceae archaeon]|nr:methyltransferase domain-containing protein [Methanotrichaceae archaeon]